MEAGAKSQRHEGTKTQRGPIPAHLERIATAVVHAAYTVHKKLGPGLLESVYEVCLAHELEKRGLRVERQVPLPVVYDGIRFKEAVRLDILIEGCFVVEVKAVEQLLPVHRAQVLTYLRFLGQRLGLLINFDVQLIKDGIHRVVL
jgi:GxxExxY protein